MRISAAIATLLLCTASLATFDASDADAQIFSRRNRFSGCYQERCHVPRRCQSVSQDCNPPCCIPKCAPPPACLTCSGTCVVDYDEDRGEWFVVSDCLNRNECYCPFPVVHLAPPPPDPSQKSNKLVGCSSIPNAGEGGFPEANFAVTFGDTAEKQQRFHFAIPPGTVNAPRKKIYTMKPIRLVDKGGKSTWVVNISYNVLFNVRKPVIVAAPDHPSKDSFTIECLQGTHRVKVSGKSTTSKKRTIKFGHWIVEARRVF